jgi:hypothetical protein
MIMPILVVHLGEGPPSDQGVGCEHGIHGCPCLITPQMEASPCRWWGALVVSGNQGTTVRIPT